MRMDVQGGRVTFLVSWDAQQKNDMALVLEGVRCWGPALKFASEALRGTPTWSLRLWRGLMQKMRFVGRAIN